MIDDKTLRLMSTEQFLYIGVIEDNKDEKFAGRYRVRILGVDGTKEDLPTEELPYAKAMNNLFCGIGFTKFYKKGSFCIVWLPLGNRNNPIILGLLPDINNQNEELDYFKDPDGVFPLEDYKGKPDTNILSASEYTYLYNQVFETESKHRIEICDKNPDKEDLPPYIRITHCDGTTLEFNNEKVELKTLGGNIISIVDKNGDKDEPSITITHPKGNIAIDKEGNLIISMEKAISITAKDALNVTAEKAITIEGKEKMDVNIKGDCNITADGNVNVKGTKINLNS